MLRVATKRGTTVHDMCTPNFVYTKRDPVRSTVVPLLVATLTRGHGL